MPSDSRRDGNYKLMKTSIPVLSIAFLFAVVAASGQTAEQDVLAAMEGWKQAVIHKDRPALEKFLHEGLIYSHSNANTQNKTEVLESVLNGKPNVDSMEFSDLTVRVFGNTALAKGRVDITTTADGKSSTAHLNVLHVLIKGPQGWQLVARQATRLPQ